MGAFFDDAAGVHDEDAVGPQHGGEAVRAAVEAGAGAAVLSRLVVAGALRLGSLVAVPFALPERRFFLLRHKERHATRALEALVATLPD